LGGHRERVAIRLGSRDLRYHAVSGKRKHQFEFYF